MIFLLQNTKLTKIYTVAKIGQKIIYLFLDIYSTIYIKYKITYLQLIDNAIPNISKLQLNFFNYSSLKFGQNFKIIEQIINKWFGTKL